MAEQFPTFENFTPPTSGNEGFSAPNQISNRETLSKSEKTARASKKVRSSTGKVIRTRQDLKDYLLKYNIDLITSAIEFNKTSSFKYSSYVVYLDHGSKREKLISFLIRYPNFKNSVDSIEKTLKNLGKNNMSFEDV